VSAARTAAVRSAAAAAAVAVVVVSPRGGPARLPLLAAIVAGAALGIVLFVALARIRPPLPRPDALAAAVVAAAAIEEALWRGGMLCGLAAWMGAPAALCATSVAFALAHGRGPSLRRLASFLALGSAFGLALLATRSLAAAIGAHATYNLLVVGTARDRPARARVEEAQT
jgi:membrane protease YdiL (CAAX protease family)